MEIVWALFGWCADWLSELLYELGRKNDSEFTGVDSRGEIKKKGRFVGKAKGTIKGI